MADFKITLTTAGKAALVDANNIGTNALTISSLELGSSYYNPTGNETALTTLIKPLTTFGGTPAANGIIHISIRDESNDAYDLGEIGLRTDAGVLLGIVSSVDGLITSKGANDVLLVAADLAFTDSNTSNITFGNANFMYQPGTEEKEGIFELATNTEVDAKAVGKIIDGKKLHDAITRRSSSAINSEDTKKLATSKAIHSLAAVIAANQATTNASLDAINTILQSDKSDLDTLQEIANVITAVKNTQNTLAIGNIAGLQTALNAKTDTGHSHVINDVTNLATTITSLITAIDGKAPTHSHPYSATNHDHDQRYGLIENTGKGRMIFGRLYSNHQATDPIPTVQYGETVNLTANANFDIRPYCITSGGNYYPGGVNTRETTGIWQCLGYSAGSDGVHSILTLWRCIG